MTAYMHRACLRCGGPAVVMEDDSKVSVCCEACGLLYDSWKHIELLSYVNTKKENGLVVRDGSWVEVPEGCLAVFSWERV